MRFWILALAITLPASALADESLDRMRAAHERAMAHYDAGRWDAAAAELHVAHDAFPAVGLLFDEAACRERMGDRKGAEKLYRRYLAEAPSAPDRADVERRLAAMRLGLDGDLPEPSGVLVVESSPPGMSVRIDDRQAAPVGQTPWNGRLAGKHTLILAADGQDDVYRAIDARPRAVQLVSITGKSAPRASISRPSLAARQEYTVAPRGDTWPTRRSAR